jgi:hypothetical protein
METAEPGYSHTFGIPAVRVGWLISRARSKANLDEKSLAVAIDVRKRIVRRWERGEQIPGDEAVEAIAAACGIDVPTLLPLRDVVEFDRASRFLRVGSSLVSVAELHNDAILNAYVELVRDQRGVLPGRPFKVRTEDLDVLATSLDLQDDELEKRLVKIIGLTPADAGELRRQIVRRRMAMPAAGLLMSGIGLFGAHFAGASSNAPSTFPSVTTVSMIESTPAVQDMTAAETPTTVVADAPAVAASPSAVLTALTGMDVQVPAADPTPAPVPAATTSAPAPRIEVTAPAAIEAPAAVRTHVPPSTTAPAIIPVMIDAGATSISNPTP